MTIYCNISDCNNWVPLQNIKHMEHQPGFTPIGKTDEYYGQCAFKSIKIKSTTAHSHTTKQVLAICGSYNSDEPTEFKCLETRCANFVDPTTCFKIQYNQNLYIDWTVAFNGFDKEEVPRCRSFAHRWRENAIDWAKVAQAQH